MRRTNTKEKGTDKYQVEGVELQMNLPRKASHNGEAQEVRDISMDIQGRPFQEEGTDITSKILEEGVCLVESQCS